MTHFQALQQRINNRLDQLVPPVDSLAEAIRYALLAPGKRLRPLLALLTAEALAPSLATTADHPALDPACALEMIHAFSLIHDDLPCMDNADLRRGRPSLHRAFDEATALLAGDGLITLAFEVLTSAPLPPSSRLELCHLFAQHAGTRGMIGGQMSDLAYEKQAITLEQLADLHRKKTGALFALATTIGGIAIGSSESLQRELFTLGLSFGTAFQIRDDLLDATASQAELGKPTDQDVTHEKASYVTLLGVDRAEHELIQAIDTLQAHLHQIPLNREPLHELITYALQPAT